MEQLRASYPIEAEFTAAVRKAMTRHEEVRTPESVANLYKILGDNSRYFFNNGDPLQFHTKFFEVLKSKWNTYRDVILESNIDIGDAIEHLTLDLNTQKELLEHIDHPIARARLMKMSGEPKYLIGLIDYVSDKIAEYRELLEKLRPYPELYEKYHIDFPRNDLLDDLAVRKEEIEQRMENIRKLASLSFSIDRLNQIQDLIGEVEDLTTIPRPRETVHNDALSIISEIMEQIHWIKLELDMVPEVGAGYLEAKQRFESGYSSNRVSRRHQW